MRSDALFLELPPSSFWVVMLEFLWEICPFPSSCFHHALFLLVHPALPPLVVSLLFLLVHIAVFIYGAEGMRNWFGKF
jgi:hypothetical protein